MPDTLALAETSIQNFSLNSDIRLNEGDTRKTNLNSTNTPCWNSSLKEPYSSTQSKMIAITPPRKVQRSTSCSSGSFGSARKKKTILSPPRSTLYSSLKKVDNGVSDRFIPDRSCLRVDLCRASVISAEKRRKAAEKGLIDFGENGDPNARTPPRQANSAGTRSSGESLTPLQTEFRRRMRSALLSLPMDESGAVANEGSSFRRSNRSTNGGSMDSDQVGSERNRESSMRSISSSSDRTNSSFILRIEGGESSLSSRSLGSELAYAPSPEPDFEDPSDSFGPGRLGRLLSFQDSQKSSRFSMGASPSRSWLTPTKRTSSAIVSPSPESRDPFSHDQLRVLHRSASERFSNSLDPLALTGEDGFRSVAKKVGRKIPTTPSRILDAPELVDDYYLNLVTWGKNNVLAVALGQRVYLWHAQTGDINHLLTLYGDSDYVTSVQWSSNPGEKQMIAVGTNNSPVQVWDTEALRPVRTLHGHSARVGSLAWNQNYLSTGGRDSLIIQHDLRSANNQVSTFAGHTQEVCGLKWNDDGTTLASGGNENYLCLWDAAMSRRNNNHHGSDARGSPSNINDNNNRRTLAPRLLLTQHQAAVKALGWCPFRRGLLASGGGTADRTIKFWNTNSGAMLNSVDTGSQVCSLLWSKHNKELCSSHGFSENQLILWKYPGMTKIQEFTGHTARVLHMEQSPDGACVVSAAADETLRFWDIFGPPPSRRKNDSFSFGNFSGAASQIR